MRIYRRMVGGSLWWRAEVGGWRVSVRFDRFRAGARRLAPGAWSVALPFVLVNVIRPWKRR